MTTTLKATLDATADALTLNPAAARVTVGAGSELLTGLGVQVTIGDRVVAVDMPEALGGGGGAPTPGEFALAALGSCQAITYRIWSERLGIPIDAVRVDINADIDIRPLLGAADSMRPGFDGVSIDVVVSGPASPEQYTELRRVVDAHCPMLDVFAHGVPTRTALAAG